MRALIAALVVECAAAAVIGIDFGARFLKVGIIQPGTGIELVLNEATKRKSSSTAGFNSMDERVYGDESQNLVGKLPQRQFVLSKLLLGKTVDSSEVKSFLSDYYPYEFAEDDRTHATMVKYGSNDTYRGEELVAFVLSYAKQIAEAHAGQAVKDCVITIPPFFDHMQRTAMIAAAQIAGLNVLSLMHENTAFAFKYGFDKESEFSSEPTNVVFYDLGASSYKVSLVSFFNTVGKKNKTTSGMTVRGVAWDETLGGRLLDQTVLEMLADEFNEKALKGKDDVRKYPKAVGKLRKEAERVKDVLSANTAYQVGIESIHDERDLRMVIKRGDFEERAKDFWPRLDGPLAEVLRQANMTKEEIHRVEVVGGATRVPRVKDAAKAFFGRETLDGSLNGDEAAAFGATLYAAKLSTSFRLREFQITDAYPHAINIKLGSNAEAEAAVADDEGSGTGVGKDKLLFKTNSKFPHKKLITMTRTDDLMVNLAYRGENGASLEPITSFNVTGVAAAVKRLESDVKRTPLGKPKVAVTFALSSSGLLEVSKAELSLEMMEKYEEWEVVASNSSASNATSEEEEAAAEPPENTDDANATNATNGSSVTKVLVEKERKRVHYSTLKAIPEAMGSVLPVSQTEIASCIERNVKLLEAEKLRKLNAQGKNDLESFIINTRDKLGSEEGIEQVSTEEERAAISADFEATEDWLYEDGKDLTKKEYEKKQAELEKSTAPIFLRLSEMEARPKVVAQSLEAINWTLTILETWTTERPEVTEAERTKVSGMCSNFTEWLEKVQAEQEATALTEPPAFLSSTVTSKLEPIEKEVRRLIKKPKPKEKKKPANSTNGTNSSSAANSTADGAAKEAEPDATQEAPKEEAKPEDTKEEL